MHQTTTCLSLRMSFVRQPEFWKKARLKHAHVDTFITTSSCTLYVQTVVFVEYVSSVVIADSREESKRSHTKNPVEITVGRIDHTTLFRLVSFVWFIVD